jgi:hypothetical protein
MPLSIAKYCVLKQSKVNKQVTPGTIVYAFVGHDYNCAREDSRYHKEAWAAFTLEDSGSYPFFTMPVADVQLLEYVEARAIPPEPERRWVSTRKTGAKRKRTSPSQRR